MPRRWPLERIVPLTWPLLLMLVLAFVFWIIPRFGEAPMPPAQPADDPATPNNHLRREAIKDAFRFAWSGYEQIAFPHDELKPVSNTPGFSRNDWGATPIDALGTAILMEEKDVVQKIIGHVQTLDFRKTKDQISVFESTIRYIGGLLSTYELLQGPFQHLKLRNTEILLHQAQALCDVLSLAFRPGDLLPSSLLDPDTWLGNGRTSLATSGTMVIEWTKLSEKTGNQTYATLAQNAEKLLLHPTFNTTEVFPGLVNQDINATTGQFQSSPISWGGSSDSFYEYLLKFHIYDPSSTAEYAARWRKAADITIENLASVPKDLPDTLFLGRYDAGLEKLVPQTGHLDCFAGGNFILGGVVLKDAKYTDFGLRLVHGCHYAYESTPTHIGPETWSWIPSECGKTTPAWTCDDPPNEQKEFYSQTQIWPTEPSYNLRPEVIESYYYAYRITKEETYRDWAWDAWIAINQTARLEHGFNYLANVMAPDGSKTKGDNQESYFFSETLKYLYLIFDDDRPWQASADGRNEWIFTTEGHLLQVRPG